MISFLGILVDLGKPKYVPLNIPIKYPVKNPDPTVKDNLSPQSLAAYVYLFIRD